MAYGPVPAAAAAGGGAAGRRPRPVQPRTNCAQVMALASAVGLIALVGVSMVFLHERSEELRPGLGVGGAVVPSAPLGLSGVARESVRFFKMRHTNGSETVQEVAMPGVAKHSVTETMLASGPGCVKLSLDDVPIDRAKRLGLGNKLGRRTLMRAAEAQARGFSVVYEFPDGHLFADGDRYNADDMETKTGHGHGGENRQRLMNALVRSPETAKIAKTAENSQQSFAIGLMAGLSEKQITEEIRKTSVTVEGLLGLVSAEAGKNTCYDTFR